MGIYNGEKYIEEQLDSILRQTRRAEEVILCDDCSTDRTVEIVRLFIERNGLQESYGFSRPPRPSARTCTPAPPPPDAPPAPRTSAREEAGHRGEYGSRSHEDAGQCGEDRSGPCGNGGLEFRVPPAPDTPRSDTPAPSRATDIYGKSPEAPRMRVSAERTGAGLAGMGD